MDIDYKVLDELLKGEAQTDDVSLTCKEEIEQFIISHDVDVFSDSSLEELAGIWSLSMGPAYEAITKNKIPNIFYVLSISLEDSENEPEQRQS